MPATLVHRATSSGPTSCVCKSGTLGFAELLLIAVISGCGQTDTTVPAAAATSPLTVTQKTLPQPVAAPPRQKTPEVKPPSQQPPEAKTPVAKVPPNISEAKAPKKVKPKPPTPSSVNTVTPNETLDRQPATLANTPAPSIPQTPKRVVRLPTESESHWLINRLQAYQSLQTNSKDDSLANRQE